MSEPKRPLELDPTRTAIVIMDLQQVLRNLPAAPRSVDEVVGSARTLAAAGRAAGATIIFVKIGREPDHLDSLRPDADRARPFSRPPPEVYEFLPGIGGPEPGDIVITKRQWGAFYGTDLELQLRRRGLDTIVVAGVATNYVVESTAREAFERGFRLVFPEDAMTGLAADEHQMALERIFPQIGRVTDTETVVGLLGGR